MKRTIVCLLVVAGFHHATAAQGPVASALSAAWSLAGPWMGVVGDEEDGVIYAIGYRRGAQVNTGGHIEQEFMLPPVSATVRLARVPRPILLTFATWIGGGVDAHDITGRRLWSYPGGGIDDVWAGDLDNDGSDEIVVGYNGGVGVHVLSGGGQLLWKSTDIGNVWHVAVGDVLGRGKPQVVTTSAVGRVHIFNGDGEGRADVVAQRVYATMVRVQRLRPDDRAATIFVAGRRVNSKGSTVTALAGEGADRWRLDLPGIVNTANVASRRPWLALGTGDGEVYVVDAVTGKVLGLVTGQRRQEVGWIGDPPLLLVATGDSLNAFRVPE